LNTVCLFVFMFLSLDALLLVRLNRLYILVLAFELACRLYKAQIRDHKVITEILIFIPVYSMVNKSLVTSR
jgi:hypothetical protein